MKVYSIPDEVPFAHPDYANYSFEAEELREKEHMAKLKAWLIENGWRGPRTGQILAVGHADGRAQYMYADGKKACLIHLPYGDAWDSPLVHDMTKSGVLKRLR